MTSSAMGTGMNTEMKLTRPRRNGVVFERSVCQGISVSSAADTRLANSIIVMVGFTNIHTFLPNSMASSFSTDQNGSVHFVPRGRGIAQDAPSSPTANGLSGLRRSSQEIRPGTATRITSNNSAYFVTLMAKGSARKVIITTTGLKLGELKRKPRAT